LIKGDIIRGVKMCGDWKLATKKLAALRQMEVVKSKIPLSILFMLHQQLLTLE
jgi:hypothetical protein